MKVGIRNKSNRGANQSFYRQLGGLQFRGRDDGERSKPGRISGLVTVETQSFLC